MGRGGLGKGAFAYSIEHDHDHVNAEDFASNIKKGNRKENFIII